MARNREHSAPRSSYLDPYGRRHGGTADDEGDETMRGPVLAVTAGIVLAAAAAVTTAAHASTVPGACGAGDLTTTVDESDMYSKGGHYFENLDVTLTNMTDTACVLEGTPAVALTGPATGSFAHSYQLPQTGTTPLLTLSRGTEARVTVRVHVLPEAQDVWQPQRMLITLPGSAETVTVAWPDGLTIQQESKPLPGLGAPNAVEAGA
ncbi:DUF4232 domain-containing protein [Actinoplanes sp. N902-109]|uniref:DUF4232 domain-containing protein n=1 Tax=Actinoplanes sp. (strain N902-109) TaxID=649831 RepID=UPI0003294C55|nr:DUF4232 domain-containing protein [Actinoplanes sp. N902-109]AGL17257.1 hypothetical protein L083_3747 [Actinoplanes sp. N902-109]